LQYNNTVGYRCDITNTKNCHLIIKKILKDLKEIDFIVFAHGVRGITPIGETINPSGNWFSSPPHKHDTNRPPIEGKFKEIYFYKVFPEQGFGIQRIYTKKHFDESYTIENNDLILIPKGYHPVVVAPGYKLYYL
jgi:hypothetical protein